MGHRFRDFTNSATVGDVAPQVMLVDASGNPIVFAASLGQKTMAASLPVVIASDQSAVLIDSELPAAAALADTTTNPTTPLAGVANLLFNGTTWDRQRTPIVFKTVTAVAITAATGATIWDPAAGKKFRLMGYCFSSSVAASLKFYQGATTALTTLIFQSPLLAAAGIHAMGAADFGNGILSTTADHNLNLDVSANATVSGTVWGTEE